jgi:hypothetical protein
MTKIAGSGFESGSISQRHVSADPDPHQNVMDHGTLLCTLSSVQRLNQEIFLKHKLFRNINTALIVGNPRPTFQLGSPALCSPALCPPALCTPALCSPALCSPVLRSPALCSPGAPIMGMSMPSRVARVLAIWCRTLLYGWSQCDLTRHDVSCFFIVL